MGGPEALSALIGEIYDAALERDRWPQVLKQICGFVEGRSSTLFAQDAARPLATPFYDYGNDPRFNRLYQEQYVHLNPLVPGMTFFDVGEVFSVFDVIAEPEFQATRFHAEYGVPQGIRDSLFCNLDKSGTSYAVISVTRDESQGPVDEGARRRLALLVPHLRRSVLIGNLIETHEAEKAVLSDVLGHVAAAVLLVDALGGITFASASAHAMMAERTIIRNVQGSIAAADPGANRMLREAFAVACDGDAALSARGVAISLTSSGEDRWLAHVLPLTGGVRREMGNTHSAVAAVFVRKAGMDIPGPLETLTKLYKLTASEARVLQALVNTGGVPDIAEALGISVTTVRTHLKGLFEKTGERRQADLVKLLAAHASPFVR